MSGSLRCGRCRAPLGDGAVRCPECGSTLDEMFAPAVTSPAVRAGGSPDVEIRSVRAPGADSGQADSAVRPADLASTRSLTAYRERYSSPATLGRLAVLALGLFAVAGLAWIVVAVAHRRTWAESGQGPVGDFGSVTDWFVLAVLVVVITGLVAVVISAMWLARSNRNLWAIGAGGRLDVRDLRSRWWPVALVAFAMAGVGLSDLADSGLSLALMVAWGLLSLRALGSILATLSDIWWRTRRDRTWPPPPGLFRMWAVFGAGALSMPVWTLFLRADPSSIATRDLQILAMVSAVLAAISATAAIRMLTRRQDETAVRRLVEL